MKPRGAVQPITFQREMAAAVGSFIVEYLAAGNPSRLELIRRELEAHGRPNYFDGLESLGRKLAKAVDRAEAPTVRLSNVTRSEVTAGLLLIDTRVRMLDSAPVSDAELAALRSVFQSLSTR